jgi:mRNA-degrading endonuclease toxin of MazEF toxin-antitoxin module
MIRPGEIYLAGTDAGIRPVVVVSREELNRGNWIVAVLVTSAQYSLRRRSRIACRSRLGILGSKRTAWLKARQSPISLSLTSTRSGAPSVFWTKCGCGR